MFETCAKFDTKRMQPSEVGDFHQSVWGYVEPEAFGSHMQ